MDSGSYLIVRALSAFTGFYSFPTQFYTEEIKEHTTKGVGGAIIERIFMANGASGSTWSSQHNQENRPNGKFHVAATISTFFLLLGWIDGTVLNSKYLKL